MRYGLDSVLGLAIIAAAAACAAEAPPAAALPPRPAIQVPYAKVTPRLDASPKDPAWADAARITGLDLHLNVPKDLKPVPTQVFVLWDEKYLYVRFVCEDVELYVPVNGHDEALYKGDVVEVFLDPKGDSRQYFEFEVNPDNSVLDSIHLLTAPEIKSDALTNALVGEIWGSEVWSFVQWNAEGLRTAARSIETDGALTGWIGEFAIPAPGILRRVGQAAYKPMKLRANFVRYEYRKQPGSETRRFIPMAWGKVMQGCPHVSPAAMGDVELVKP